jgi:hypothetical protein
MFAESILLLLAAAVLARALVFLVEALAVAVALLVGLKLSAR